MTRIPPDYEERVYAGVLGKIIGVYVGRPFEGWSHERIVRELGEIKYYVHERMSKPLVVIDDDISGTFAFLRAMPDYGNPTNLSAAQIGQTWLNYLVENKTILWWGGMGTSTEHTAFLRLKAGIAAPESGSTFRNGAVVAQQIGAQIFIDGWGMITPGDPERAADFARRAASVSHDGEAIYGAQVVAAMEAQAFVEHDLDALLDVGTSVIPTDSVIYGLIDDLRDWRGKHESWYESYNCIVAKYGYDRYGGGCHIVPNHGLIILALLYCEDSFAKAMTIVNTAGWDTDCNSGNVGCLMGIKNGLAGLDAGPDFRGPVSDRMYVTSAEGGRVATDAVQQAFEVTKTGRALAQDPVPPPKDGALFHFDLPGAVQGFLPDEDPDCRGVAWIESVLGHSEKGRRSLAVRYRGLTDGRYARVIRDTFPDPERVVDSTHSYRLVASPALYAGQLLEARVEADGENGIPVQARLLMKAHGEDDALFTVRSPEITLEPGQDRTLAWTVDVPVGCPIAWVGVELTSERRAEGTVYIDWMNWSGEPCVEFDAPLHQGARWLNAWVQACDRMSPGGGRTFSIVQNAGLGMVTQGTRDWHDYRVGAELTPHLARSYGLAARVQGLKRYYALLLTLKGTAQLVRELDGTLVLAEAPCAWELYEPRRLDLEVQGHRISGCIDGEVVLEVMDESFLTGGGVALLVEEGRLGCGKIEVRPVGWPCDNTLSAGPG